MKINWGAGIAVLYLGFVAMILVLVGMSVNQKIDMVTDHYYDEELKFQDKINKTKRANLLTEPIIWQVNDDGLKIDYPADLAIKGISGKINLYCPSNDKNDRNFPVQESNGQQIIPVEKIPEGRYRLQIDWKSGNESYWNEDVILISHNSRK